MLKGAAEKVLNKEIANNKNRGSAVVEATLILPLFLFAMLAVYHMHQVHIAESAVYEYLGLDSGILSNISDLFEAELPGQYRQHQTRALAPAVVKAAKLTLYKKPRPFLRSRFRKHTLPDHDIQRVTAP